jgi:hypothetical protein
VPAGTSPTAANIAADLAALPLENEQELSSILFGTGTDESSAAEVRDLLDDFAAASPPNGGQPVTRHLLRTGSQPLQLHTLQAGWSPAKARIIHQRTQAVASIVVTAEENDLTTRAVRAVAKEAIAFLTATNVTDIPPVDLNRPAHNRHHAKQVCNLLATTMEYAQSMTNTQSNLQMFLGALRRPQPTPVPTPDPTPAQP